LRIDAAASLGLSGVRATQPEAPEPSDYPPNRRRRKPSHPRGAPHDGSGVHRSRLDLVTDWVAEARRAQYQATKLADLCDVSARTLRRFFSQSTGLSPQHWLNEVRVLDATAQLFKAELTIKDVSASMGFTSSRRFWEHFKRVWGVPPAGFAASAPVIHVAIDRLTGPLPTVADGPAGQLLQLRNVLRTFLQAKTTGSPCSVEMSARRIKCP
jgi:methylphosphotriester-DNA--protein-cysteine methyltransferase